MATFSFIKYNQLVQFFATLSASLTCLGYGLHYAWTSPTVPKLLNDKSKNITVDEASYLVVSQSLGMLITSPLFSILIDKIGRKRSVLLSTVPQVIGWIMIVFAENIWVLYLARFIVGISDAAIYTTVPVYVCEILEPSVRNSYLGLISIGINSGIVIINVLGSHFEVWVTAVICFGFSCFAFLTILWVPESPYYLLMKNRTQDAEIALRTLRMTDKVNEEVCTLTADVQRQMSESGTWKELFLISSNRKALFLSTGVKALQNLCGLVAFEVYTQYMFEEADVIVPSATSALVFSGTVLICSGCNLYIMGKFGRRPLLIFSALGCGFSLAAEAIYFAIKQFTNFNTSEMRWFPLAALIVYVIFCSCGLISIPTVYVGEVASTSVKSKVTIITNLVFAVGFLITPKLFEILVVNFGMLAPFCLFSVCCLIGVIPIYMFVVETKNKTLEEIQQELKTGQNRQKRRRSINNL